MKAFAGDYILKKEFEKLIKENDVKNIVETGTFKGDTTKEFSKMVDNVYTIENKKIFFEEAGKNLKDCKNVKLYLGDSKEVMNEILPYMKGRTLFFLDSHWRYPFPIIDELKEIAKHEHLKDSVIVIHDFYVPGKDFGYDSYYSGKGLILFIKRALGYFGLVKKQRLDYEYIKDGINEINPLYNYYYNSQAEGSKRGVIFIYLKK